MKKIFLICFMLIVAGGCQKNDDTPPVRGRIKNSDNPNTFYFKEKVGIPLQVYIKRRHIDPDHPYMQYIVGVKNKNRTLCFYTIENDKIIAQREEILPEQLKIREKWFSPDDIKIDLRERGSVVLASLEVYYRTVDTPNYWEEESAYYKKHFVLGNDKISDFEVYTNDPQSSNYIMNIEAYIGMGFFVTLPGLTNAPRQFYDLQWNYLGLYYPSDQEDEIFEYNGYKTYYYIFKIKNEAVLYKVVGQQVVAKDTKTLPFDEKEKVRPKIFNKVIHFINEKKEWIDYTLVVRDDKLIEAND